MQGIRSEITSENTVYDIGYQEVDPIDINATYDCVILPMANIFSEVFLRFMTRRTDFLKKIEIPVYVIACGLQCRSKDELPGLIEKIGKESKEFIDVVYATGGEFCLRGNTTKEFFDMLGNNSAVVTGCPSMFQMGRNLKISNEKVDRETFKASLNGSFNLPISRQDFQKCDFIDQDRYIEMLFRPNYLASHPINFRTVLSDVAYRGYVYSQSLADRRIKAFLDTQQWMRYFEVEDIDFSFGSRIHGTIMPILSGVPSMIVPCDARTREMAEFFDIPMYDSKSQKNCDLYELYCQTDYTKFNENFTSRYDAFEDFLVDHNIVDRINPSNIYMQKNNASTIMPPNVNNDYFMAYAQCFNKNRFFLYSADTVVKLMRRVKRR